VSVFAIVILSTLALLFKSKHEELVGGIDDAPEEMAPEIAGTIFMAVLVYAVRPISSPVHLAMASERIHEADSRSNHRASSCSAAYKVCYTCARVDEVPSRCTETTEGDRRITNSSAGSGHSGLIIRGTLWRFLVCGICMRKSVEGSLPVPGRKTSRGSPILPHCTKPMRVDHLIQSNIERMYRSCLYIRVESEKALKNVTLSSVY
jgi:hypothetical protein